MEIAELSTSEKSAVAEHAESLTRPDTPEAAFKEFASRDVGHAKAEAKDKPEPKDAKPVDLSKANREQLQEWNETGTVTPKAESKKESSEPAGEPKTATKEGELDVRAEAEPRIRELNEKAWHQKFEGKDHDDWMAHVNKQAQAGVDFVAKHEHSQKIQSGLRNVFSGLPQPEAQARFHDFTLALNEVRNPGAVLAEIGLDETARNVLMAVRTRQQMRNVVFGLAVELMQKAGSSKPSIKAEERRPRAPKPPSEVGGRGSPSERADIAAAREGNFKAFDAAMRAKYRASR